MLSNITPLLDVVEIHFQYEPVNFKTNLIFSLLIPLALSSACGDDVAPRDAGSDVSPDIGMDTFIDSPSLDVEPDSPAQDTGPDVTSAAPSLSVEVPPMSGARQVRLRGVAVDDVSLASVELTISGNTQEVMPRSNGEFEVDVLLTPGDNLINVVARDDDNNETTAESRVYFGHRVSVGNSQGVALVDGSIYTWGRNELGQLGNGTLQGSEWDDDPDTPELPIRYEVDIDNVVSVVTRQTFMLALKSDGTVWSWGDNGFGQLGYSAESDCGRRGESPCRRTPTQIPGISNAVQVAAGFDHSLVLLEDGSVLSFGEASDGQLGRNGDPRAVAQVEGLPANIIQVAAGAACSFAVTDDGAVYAWGDNGHGQLGLAADDGPHATPVRIDSLNRIASIAAGNSTPVALDHNGRVWTLGRNINGQLGIGSESIDYTDMPGEVQLEGAPIENIMLTTGDGFVAGALTRDGNVYMWGMGALGQLGQGNLENGDRDLENRYSASQVEAPSGDPEIFTIVEIESGAGGPTLARTADGLIFGWGWSFRGSLGIEGAINAWAYSTPVLIIDPSSL